MNDITRTRLNEAGVDIKGTLERFLGNEAMYEKFLSKFVSDPNFQLLCQSVSEQNYDEVERVAHTMKGVAGNLGLNPVQDLLQLVVNAVRAGDYQAIEGFMAQLTPKYDLICNIIDEMC